MKGNLRDFFKANNIPQDDEVYFAYSASLRISGNIENLYDITTTLNVQPTYTHKKGEKHSERSTPYKDDMRMYSTRISEEKHLSGHITELWNAINIPAAERVSRIRRSMAVLQNMNFIWV